MPSLTVGLLPHSNSYISFHPKHLTVSLSPDFWIFFGNLLDLLRDARQISTYCRESKL